MYIHTRLDQTIIVCCLLVHNSLEVTSLTKPDSNMRGHLTIPVKTVSSNQSDCIVKLPFLELLSVMPHLYAPKPDSSYA